MHLAEMKRDAAMKAEYEDFQRKRAVRQKAKAEKSTIERAKHEERQEDMRIMKAAEREGYKKNRETYLAKLREKREKMVRLLVEERNNHWILDPDTQLNENLFDTRYNGLVGFWVKSNKAKWANQGGFEFLTQSKEGKALDMQEDEEMALLDFRNINNPRVTYRTLDMD